MQEKLLHYIWQHSYYNQRVLNTLEGDEVQVIFPGQYNTNQGPDFLEAKVRIGDTVFVGSVEIHVNSSDWHKHGHSTDVNYNNVILHVVYQHDQDTGLPELELKDRISRSLLDHYESLMDCPREIACSASISEVSSLVLTSWKERVLMERLERRSAVIFRLLEQNQYHWEETLWWMLARNFGGTINGDAFEEIGRTISVNILAKHRNQVIQLEAMLLGQAGLLRTEFTDPYALLLKREYLFLKNKYALKPVAQTVQFLRMRPGNFPTVRLAQLAMLVHKSNHLFSAILHKKESKDIMRMMDVTANDHWHYHYRLNEETKFLPKRLGKDALSNIMINTVVPILFANGLFKKESQLQLKALNWLEELPAEKNSITKTFEELGIENRSAFDSQALIEMKKNYCNHKKCLQCAVGNFLLKMDCVPNTHLDL